MTNGTATRTFSLNVFLTRAPDIDGQWVGHCSREPTLRSAPREVWEAAKRDSMRKL